LEQIVYHRETFSGWAVVRLRGENPRNISHTGADSLRIAVRPIQAFVSSVETLTPITFCLPIGSEIQ
jgi:hypothetical protein